MRVLIKANVIYIAGRTLQGLIEKMHMRYADSLEIALAIAEDMVPGGRYVIIPNGVSVVVDDGHHCATPPWRARM